MVHYLQQALLETCLNELHLINVDGSGRGGSLAFIQTLLTSMMSTVQVGEKGSLFTSPDFCCKLSELTLKTRLSDVLEGPFCRAVYTGLAQCLPQMSHLRILRARSQDSTYALLWEAVFANESLTSIDVGTSFADGIVLEPVMERNRLLQRTRRFCCQKRSMHEVVAYALQLELFAKIGDMSCTDSSDVMDTVTTSSIYELVRSCIPPNIKECQEPNVNGPLSEEINAPYCATFRTMEID
jgi:hypothetical protein